MELDTEEGWAKYAVLKPRAIDLVAVEAATHGAGYTLKEVEIETAGTVTRGHCERCGKEVRFLKLDHTGQRFELRAQTPIDGHVRIRGTLSGWAGGHPVIKVSELTEREGEPSS